MCFYVIDLCPCVIEGHRPRIWVRGECLASVFGASPFLLLDWACCGVIFGTLFHLKLRFACRFGMLVDCHLLTLPQTLAYGPLHHLLVDCESLTLLFFILISLWRSCPLQNFPCVCILELVSCGVMCYMLNDCTFGNRESAYDEFERLNVVVHGSGVSWSHL